LAMECRDRHEALATQADLPGRPPRGQPVEQKEPLRRRAPVDGPQREKPQ
jgi:hypothetical protein